MTREREEAKRILYVYRAVYLVDASHRKAFDMAIEALEQEPKTGHWIDTGSGQKCSECGEIQYGYDSFRRFCAYCGARMQVVGNPDRLNGGAGMPEIIMTSKPFDWNDNLSEEAQEAFSEIKKGLSYYTSQTIGMALAKLELLEKQGCKVEPQESEETE